MIEIEIAASLLLAYAERCPVHARIETYFRRRAAVEAQGAMAGCSRNRRRVWEVRHVCGNRSSRLNSDGSCACGHRFNTDAFATVKSGFLLIVREFAMATVGGRARWCAAKLQFSVISRQAQTKSPVAGLRVSWRWAIATRLGGGPVIGRYAIPGCA